MIHRPCGSVHAFARALFGVAVLHLAIGCGGGGGSSGPAPLTNAVFNGSYFVAAFLGLVSPTVPADADYRSSFGSMLANGEGGTLDGSGRNNDGTVTPPGPGDLDSSSVAADGTLALFNGASTGGIRSDGGVAVAMLNESGASPSAIVLLRSIGGYSNGSFAGEFHLAQIYGRVGGPAPTSLFTTTALGALVSNGAGATIVPTMNVNNVGVLSAAPGGAAVYAVAADGTLTIALLNGNYQGGVSPDGLFAIAAGGTVAGQDPQMAVLIKKSTFLTNAAFSGEYWAVGIASEPTDQNRWTSFAGTVTSNGAGAMSYASTTADYEGVIFASSGPDTYSVSADGSLTTPGGRVGAVSQDGRYAFLSGSLTAGAGPLLFVFVRK